MRRSSKRRTYKGVNTHLQREKNMAYENSLSTRKYGMVAVAAMARTSHKTGTGESATPTLQVTSEDALNMDNVRELGTLSDQYVQMYERVLAFCTTKLTPYSDDFPHVFVNSDKFVVVDLKSILQSPTFLLEDYFAADGTFVLQRFLQRFPTLDALKEHVASFLDDCPSGKTCDGLMSSCVKIGERCVTKDSLTNFHTRVENLKEFAVLDTVIDRDNPIRIGKHVKGFYSLLFYSKPRPNKNDYLSFMSSTLP